MRSFGYPAITSDASKIFAEFVGTVEDVGALFFAIRCRGTDGIPSSVADVPDPGVRFHRLITAR